MKVSKSYTHEVQEIFLLSNDAKKDWTNNRNYIIIKLIVKFYNNPLGN